MAARALTMAIIDDIAGLIRTARSSVGAGVLALVLMLVAGAALISFYISGEEERDLRQWESRLRLVADARADAVVRLLDTRRRELGDLAANASLQVYLWQYTQERGDGASPVDSAPLGYLRNLLLAAAERGGYLPDPATRIPANVTRSAATGLALLDADRNPVFVTPGLGDIGVQYRPLLDRVLGASGGAAVELLLDEAERPVLAIAVPVDLPSGVSRAGRNARSGVLLGIRSASQELLPLLHGDPVLPQSSETLLLQRLDDSVIFLAPDRGGGASRRSLPLERDSVAEVAAVLSPGRFSALDNYQGREVLQVSRAVRGQDWILAQQVDAGEAMQAANERRGFLLTALSLLLLFIAASVIAAWRHGSSVRARQHAVEMEARAAKLQRQTDLLHAISDNIDVLTLLTANDHEVLFTNHATALAVRVRRPELVGQRLSGIFGAATAELLEQLSAQAWRHGGPVQDVLRVPLDDGPRSFLVSGIPIERLGEREGLTLLVLNDITELERIEARHADLLRRLVGTLAHVVDQRDPYAAEHTRRTAQVADAVARELALGDHERETLDLAATLSNIGKIMIPTEILTKKAPLTAAEQELLRKHVDYTLELLQGVEFDGPVLDIIAQKQERLDGTGYPRGLTDEQMSMTGRILSVANAFVALISVRAYRDGVSVEDALDELLAGAGTRYDRRVIAALFHVAENRADWSGWSHPQDRP